MLQNRCDVHTHTLYSRHAYSTVRENVLAAREAGLELLGVTDHFSDMLFPNTDLTRGSLRDYQHFINMRVWPRTWEGIRLLHGAEIVVSLLMELRLRDAQVVEDGDPLVVARDLEELFPVDPVFRQLVRRLQQHDLRGVAPPAIIGIEGGQHAELGQFPVDIAMLGENGCLDLPGLPVEIKDNAYGKIFNEY